MKNIMILIVFIFIGNTLFAQDNKEQFLDEYEKQIGLSATNFFLRFISFTQGLENTPDVLILYKKGTGGQKWRYGLGGSISFNSIKDEDNERDRNTEILLSYRFGREHYRNFSRKWGILFGWETHYRGNYSKSVNIDDVSIGQETRTGSIFNLTTGVRALAGVQFRINERLSLLTETSYGISLSYRKWKSVIEIDSQPGNSTESFSKRYSASTFFNAPLSIILNYHF